MNRSEFLRKCAALGIGLPVASFLLQACDDDITSPNFTVNFSGKVLIIGAGSAGLTAGYLLHRHNIDFEILEAAPVMGGRMKRIEGFADFPIDLGAEWIHDNPDILARLIRNPDVKASVDMVTYNPQTIHKAKDGEISKINWASNFYSEYKFKSTTWFGFFEKFIAADIQDKIKLESVVEEIDHTNDKVSVKLNDGTVMEADKVLVTVPIKVLQDKDIVFKPALTQIKQDAIDSIQMDAGLKVFIEFKERFYPDIVLFGGFIQAITTDSKAYYDAAFGKDSSRNILGLFSINEDAAEFTSLGSDQDIVDAVLAELDQLFDGQATKNYVKHVVQNWSKEPFIRGSYSYTFNDGIDVTMERLLVPIDDKVYFAGEAMSKYAQATVHGAALTAYEVVEKMLA
jgi:monoamine oxidase